MKIGNFELNSTSAPYIIAEAGVNHNGSYDLAIKLIDEAVKAGAHAIKWQVYKAETLCVEDAPRFWEWEGEIKKEGSQFDSYKELDGFPLEDYGRLADYCRQSGIEFLATPFDEEALEFLESINVAAYKIASCDCTNIPFLKLIARTNRPIIMSTGAATLEEIKEAVETIAECGNDQTILLHCILCYPTRDEDANLSMIGKLKNQFPNNIIGLSDHTLGTDIPIAAVAFGAELIEKHYTVDKTLPKSADHWLSVDPTELKQIVDGTARVKKAIGLSWPRPLDCEIPTRSNARRSVVAAQNIKAGVTISPDMLTCKRPGTGLKPNKLESLIGKTATNDLSKDTLVKLTDFE
jgi:N,N'-diacetyllegionaminate synthase